MCFTQYALSIAPSAHPVVPAVEPSTRLESHGRIIHAARTRQHVLHRSHPRPPHFSVPFCLCHVELREHGSVTRVPPARKGPVAEMRPKQCPRRDGVVLKRVQVRVGRHVVGRSSRGWTLRTVPRVACLPPSSIDHRLLRRREGRAIPLPRIIALLGRQHITQASSASSVSHLVPQLRPRRVSSTDSADLIRFRATYG